VFAKPAAESGNVEATTAKVRRSLTFGGGQQRASSGSSLTLAGDVSMEL